MKIRPSGAELFHWTGRWTDMTKPTVTFLYFANAPKTSAVNSLTFAEFWIDDGFVQLHSV
jgi:hypothetical protein